MRALPIRHTPRGEFNASVRDWKPGQLHPNLSWSLFRELLRLRQPLPGGADIPRHVFPATVRVNENETITRPAEWI